MPILKLALIAGACACPYVSWASWSAGFPPEVALTRGVGGFMALSLLGFLGQLVATRAHSAGVPPAPPSYQPAEDPEPSV